ncbi:MAG: DUF2848 family protein [Thermodesulfobacteriota bacterium]
MNELRLTLERKSGSSILDFRYSRMVNAGYVGRNQAEVRRHIEELAKKGIPGPKTTPVLYPVVGRMVVTEPEIEVYGGETSGEVEYVLLVARENEVYVGLGSDHTDRHLEESDIPRSKQICPNVLGRKVWPLEEVAGHWDELVIRSHVFQKGEKTLYQEGRLGLILDPAGLMAFVRSKVPGSLEDIIIFSGTLGTLAGGFVFGDRFAAELVDEKLGRTLELAYDVRPLDYLVVD